MDMDHTALHVQFALKAMEQRHLKFINAETAWIAADRMMYEYLKRLEEGTLGKGKQKIKVETGPPPIGGRCDGIQNIGLNGKPEQGEK